jgi:hypothetical protein
MAWELRGNAGTDPTVEFIGTTDNQPLVIRTVGKECLRVDTNGNVGIGTNATPTATLEVNGTIKSPMWSVSTPTWHLTGGRNQLKDTTNYVSGPLT